MVITCTKSGGKPMKASSVKLFSKKLACPSSNLLLSFHYRTLAPELDFQVKHHLTGCDFCYCEIPLLAFYTRRLKGECRPPDLPINLRILAESILGQDRYTVSSASAGPEEFALNGD
jgi:hypothetical protein